MEQRLTTDSSIVRSLTAQLDGGLIQQLSYTHIELLVPLESEQKRSFYQAQCIAGSWSVRQLKRQINSLLYERSQLRGGAARKCVTISWPNASDGSLAQQRFPHEHIASYPYRPSPSDQPTARPSPPLLPAGSKWSHHQPIRTGPLWPDLDTVDSG